MSQHASNAYYIPRCDFVERSPSYASCLWKITENAAGRSANYPSHADCVPHIEAKRCKACGMQQQEELAGVAMYFFPRQFHQNQVVTSLTPADQIPRAASHKRGLPDPVHRASKGAAPAPRVDVASTRNDYADAINAAMQTLADPPAPAPAPEPKAAAPELPVPQVKPALPAMLAGESPIQYARRTAALRQAQKETV